MIYDDHTKKVRNAIARAYAESARLLKGTDTGLDRVKDFCDLVDANPDHSFRIAAYLEAALDANPHAAVKEPAAEGWVQQIKLLESPKERFDFAQRAVAHACYSGIAPDSKGVGERVQDKEESYGRPVVRRGIRLIFESLDETCGVDRESLVRFCLGCASDHLVARETINELLREKPSALSPLSLSVLSDLRQLMTKHWIIFPKGAVLES